MTKALSRSGIRSFSEPEFLGQACRNYEGDAAKGKGISSIGLEAILKGGSA